MNLKDTPNASAWGTFYSDVLVNYSTDADKLCKGGELPQRFLGFDLGNWGGGNYSILCDAMIWPVWHPPFEEAFAKLSVFARMLNSNLLFPSLESAQEYLDWYSTQDWAEKPPEEFSIIGVGVVGSP